MAFLCKIVDRGNFAFQMAVIYQFDGYLTMHRVEYDDVSGSGHSLIQDIPMEGYENVRL
jgi:hypothetical protein